MNDLRHTNEFKGTSGSEVLAHWRSSGWPLTPDGLRVPAVDLELSEGSFFRGSVFSDWQNIRRVYAGFLRVAPEERGYGRGRHMVRGLGALAHKYAFPEMSVGIASQYSLDIFANVFGMDRITLYGLESGGRDINAMLSGEPKRQLGMGFTEARAELVALEQDEEDPEDRQLGYYAFVGLDGLDMSKWELPIEHCKSILQA